MKVDNTILLQEHS